MTAQDIADASNYIHERGSYARAEQAYKDDPWTKVDEHVNRIIAAAERAGKKIDEEREAIEKLNDTVARLGTSGGVAG